MARTGYANMALYFRESVPDGGWTQGKTMVTLVGKGT